VAVAPAGPEETMGAETGSQLEQKQGRS